MSARSEEEEEEKEQNHGGAFQSLDVGTVQRTHSTTTTTTAAEGDWVERDGLKGEGMTS